MINNFNELRKAAKTLGDGKLKIAVAGDCATQFLTTALKGTLAIRGIGAKFFEAEYNQIQRQILSTDSELNSFKPDIVVVWECVEHWWCQESSVEERLNAVASYANAISCKLIYINAAPYRDGVFGSFVAEGKSFAAQLRAFNSGLDALASKIPNLYIADLNSIIADMGRMQSYDAPTFMLSDMPLTLDACAMLGSIIGDIVEVFQGKTKKCVVVDLDNTLWGGIIGEDGLAGILLGEHGIGKAFTKFQHFLKRLKERGILLAVCSKNDEAIAKEVFEKHPDMILHLDDIACFVANWQNKAENIAYIQKVLNIGIDSFVFLDDNPVEREIVRKVHPQVFVPELPDDPSLWVEFLANENVFEVASYSVNDMERTHQYQVEVKRQEFALSFKDEKSFLQGLDMKATCAPLDDFTIPRAAQLSQRSNQFNLRTVRYTDTELKAYSCDDSVIQLGFTLEDKFGSHGLVSVMIAKKITKDAFFIDSWFMSCRVLKRGLEYYALNKLVSLIKSRGAEKLIGEYLPTKKNAMVANLLSEMGFVDLCDGHFELDLINYKNKETQINENE